MGLRSVCKSVEANASNDDRKDDKNGNEQRSGLEGCKKVVATFVFSGEILILKKNLIKID